MTLISIQIPVTHGRYLVSLLESIRSQTYQNFEIVAVNSGSSEVTEKLKEYGAKVIEKKVKLLEARYLANEASKGDFALLLDETRPLATKDALEKLAALDHDMVIIGEKELGNGFWARLADLDKRVIMECTPIDPVSGIALPRYFRRELLTRAFVKIKENLKDKFSKIVFRDHEIIFYESFKISKDIYVIKDILLYHYSDNSIISIFKKYYRYGKSLKVLKDTVYEFMVTPRMRKLCIGSWTDKLTLNLLYTVRGVPFIVGYLLGKA